MGELKWVHAGIAVDRHLNNSLEDSSIADCNLDCMDMHSKLVLIDHRVGFEKGRPAVVAGSEIDHMIGFEKGQSIVGGIEHTLMDHKLGFEKDHRHRHRHPVVAAGTDRKNPWISSFNLRYTLLHRTLYYIGFPVNWDLGVSFLLSFVHFLFYFILL